MYVRMTLFLILFGLLAASPGAAAKKPGEIFRDCETCPEMVVVPPGFFVMGLGGLSQREGPPREVIVPKPFAIGRYEVTFDEWDACVEARGCSHDPDDHKWGRGTRPVINVDYHKVEEFIAWISSKTGETYYIPSEAEWEYAHRAGTVTAFPWGDEAGVNNANCKDCKSEWSGIGTAPVGSFKPNAFGLYDTVANAFEWTADCWNTTHDGAPDTAVARTDGDCQQRVMRGGSFYYFQKVSRAAYRSKNPVNVKSYWLGFRVARKVR